MTHNFRITSQHWGWGAKYAFTPQIYERGYIHIISLGHKLRNETLVGLMTFINSVITGKIDQISSVTF